MFVHKLFLLLSIILWLSKNVLSSVLTILSTMNKFHMTVLHAIIVLIFTTVYWHFNYLLLPLPVIPLSISLFYIYMGVLPRGHLGWISFWKYTPTLRKNPSLLKEFKLYLFFQQIHYLILLWRKHQEKQLHKLSKWIKMHSMPMNPYLTH